MTHLIRAKQTSHDTTDWRVTFDDGTYICDIRLSISSMLNGSRYYVFEGDQLGKEGTFNFGVWDWDTVKETVTAIVKSLYADAEVSFDLVEAKTAS